MRATLPVEARSRLADPAWADPAWADPAWPIPLGPIPLPIQSGHICATGPIASGPPARHSSVQFDYGETHLTQRNATRYNAMRHDTTQCNTIQVNATRYNEMQHNTTHCNTNTKGADARCTAGCSLTTARSISTTPTRFPSAGSAGPLIVSTQRTLLSTLRVDIQVWANGRRLVLCSRPTHSGTRTRSLLP